jgi:hypothetical protein
MAGFQGWWVNGQTGKGYHVAEHGLDIEANPERYGFTEEEVKRLMKGYNAGDTDPEGVRGKLLKAAMQKGWVRVRGYQGKYAIQTFGSTASHLKKVLPFMKKNGVGAHSEILVSDLLSGYQQRFMDGMSDIVTDLKAGKIPDTSAPVSAVVKKGLQAVRGIPSGLSDKQSRTLMRQRIGQRLHVPDPTPGEGFLPESKAFRRGLRKLLQS